jgi:hypothetical protein
MGPLFGRFSLGRVKCVCGHECRAHKNYYKACAAFDCFCVKFKEA